MILAIVGEESLLVRRRLEKILSERLPQENRDFNFDSLEGSEVQAKKVMELIGTLPMFAERRVILIKNAHELKKGELSILEKALGQIPPTTDLIFSAGKIDRRFSFWQRVAEMGKLEELKPLGLREAPSWLMREAKEAGYQMNLEAAGWIVSAVGSDLAMLEVTLKKLLLFKGESRNIVLQDVEACVTGFSWKNLFELTESIGEKNLGKSFQLFNRMMHAGESPVALTALLGRHFRILSKVKEGNAEGIPPFFLRDYQRQAEKFKNDELDQKREKIFWTDWALKSSPLESTILFERLMLDLCRR